MLPNPLATSRSGMYFNTSYSLKLYHIKLLYNFIWGYNDMRTRTQHTEQAGENGCLVLPILLHRYLVKYGPGEITFFTHIHNNRCIYMCWDYHRYFIELYIDTF